MGKDRDVDAVLCKCAGVLGQAEPCEPIGYFLHRRPRPADFGLVDPLDGRFYPIDRAPRNRPERSAAGVTGGPAQRATDESRPRVRRGRRLKMQPLRGAPFGLFRSYKPFPCTMLATEGQNMATSAERMRALRERQRRGLRRLTIEVSEDDLRAIAKRGYEGSVTTDHDQQAQAVGLFLSDVLLQFGRLYALRFALEQLRQNFEDFRNRVAECARADREA
jgi:hypothetical protein